MKEGKIAIYPGTFDPITLGHLDIIKRSATLFDKLIIAVATDTLKSTLFSIDERVNMINSEIEHNKMKNVIIKPFKGLLVKFVKNENANIIIRGLRAVADFEYEFQLALLNDIHRLQGIENNLFRNQDKKLNIYDDSQNVHNSNVNQSVISVATNLTTINQNVLILNI